LQFEGQDNNTDMMFNTLSE